MTWNVYDERNEPLKQVKFAFQSHLVKYKFDSIENTKPRPRN